MMFNNVNLSIMRKLPIIFCLLLLTGFCFSCSTETTEIKKPIDFSDKILDLEDLIGVGNKVELILEEYEFSDRETDHTTAALKINKTLEPLIQSGKLLQKEILSRIDLSPDNHKLSAEEITAIKSMDRTLLAEVSLIFSSLHHNPNYPKRMDSTDNIDPIMNCISAALGINAIYTIISSTSKLITAKEAAAIFKIVAKRYALGYVAFGVALYSFGRCMDYW